MKIQKLFQKTRFGIFALFGVIVLSTSILCIYTVDTQLSAEYVTNSANIAQSIADSSVDILLNRDLATLQSMIDQFVEIQGISYIYITSEEGEFLAHTFVPGIPEEIIASDPFSTEPVERNLPGMGDFMEVGSPILVGVAGTVHVGMDLDLVALKIQRAIGQQVNLICIFLVVGVLASIWLVNLAAKPLGELLAYAVALAGAGAGRTDLNEAESAATYLRTPQFLIMWIVFFFNIAAGISVIGFQLEILQEVWGFSDPSVEPATLAAYGATLIAVSSICNGLARISHELSATAPDPSASARPLTRLIRRDERAATRPARGTRRSSDGVSDSSRRKPVRKAG